MSGDKTGGPAFPPTDYGNGMTLRDWFAGQALGGFLAAFAGDGVQFPADRNAAKNAYDYADAMLAERAARS